MAKHRAHTWQRHGTDMAKLRVTKQKTIFVLKGFGGSRHQPSGRARWSDGGTGRNLPSVRVVPGVASPS